LTNCQLKVLSMSRFSLLCAAGVATVSAFGAPDVFTLADFSPDDCVEFVGALNPDCEQALEQSPADITKGNVGLREPTGVLIEDYAEKGMCQTNVHWHLGAEHRSEGEYDVDGADFLANTYHGEDADVRRRLLSEEGEGPLPGYFCPGYDAEEPMYTEKYAWEYCVDMHVGLTYEVHWPHSSAGHCGHLTDGLAGLFCQTSTPAFVGVQGQVFQIVNDDAYDVDDLVFGMITDSDSDIAKYTGSSTGTKYDNEICSAYGGISWHVDRACHKVSAKSFDAMCKYMQEQGQTADLEPHGSRVLVSPEFVTSATMTR